MKHRFYLLFYLLSIFASCSPQKGLMSSIKITKLINGVVMEENGPLPGATIQLKNTNRGTYTDMDGKFEIIANESEILIIRYVGLESKEVKVTDKNYYEVKLEVATPFVSRKEKRRIKRELRKHGFYIYPD